MKTISFEKLRAQFWDASFELPGYHSHCTGFHHNFSFEFNESMTGLESSWQIAGKNFQQETRKGL
jgi:hypothetical protein